MQDNHPQIKKLCSLWWKSRDIDKDHSLFKIGGPYYIEGSYNAERCWIWQIKQFINSEFEYIDKNNIKQVFKPIDLDEELLERLIGQLSIDIGLFFRDFIKIYRKYIKNVK